MEMTLRTDSKTKGRAIASACAAIVLAGTIGVLAAFTSQGSAEATASTGKVGVELAEVVAEPDRLLVSGSTVACDTSVTNTGADGWVRCKIDHCVSGGIMGEARWTGGETVESAGWVLAEDGWWYSTAPVPSGATVPFESSVAFPVFEQVAEGSGWEWLPVTGEMDMAKWKTPSPDEGDDESLMTYCGAEGSMLVETVTAHVIQAKNFEPDFDAASPWGDVDIEGVDASSSKEVR